MKLSSIFVLFVIFSLALLSSLKIFAVCGDTWQFYSADTYTGSCEAGSVTPYDTTKHWRIFWTDGYERNDAKATGSGKCVGGYIYNTYCLASFATPYWSQNTAGFGEWNQKSTPMTWYGRTSQCGVGATGDRDNFHRHNCGTVAGGCNGEPDWQYPSGCASGFIYSGGVCTRSDEFINRCDRFGGYNFEGCGCFGGCEDEYGNNCSPVVIDVSGNGFTLTNALNGVNFDVDGNGTAERRAWTTINSDDSWLALDRNGNGSIDGGRELFGSATVQPPPPTGTELNGFNALAEYDERGFGGNKDGQIDNQDAIFPSLRLWRDVNHNGVSEADELKTLPDSGLRTIDLDYKESRRVDQHGNQFKYRTKVKDAQGAQLGRWAWDVFLVR